MIHKSLLVGLMVAVTMVGGLANGQAPRTAKDPDSASAALAERFFDLAQQSVPQQAAMPQHRQQMAALLEAAWRLNPEEPRFARPLADELMKQRQFGRALTVLNALRKVRPDDRIAQLRAIEAYLGQMETVDRKLDYLKSVVAAESLPPEVRSIAAGHAAALFEEKQQPDEFRKMAELALKLNPLSLPALKVQYLRLPDDATQAQRLELELGLLMSNPGQVDVLIEVARRTARAGLLEDSLRWYGQTVVAAQRAGSQRMIDIAMELAAQHILAGQTEVALRYLTQIIQNTPQPYPPLVLSVLALDLKGDKEQATKARDLATNILVTQIQMLRAKIGAEQATTRPVNEGKHVLPDLSRDVERFKANPEQQNAYLAVLGDLAWFELFFNQNVVEGERLHKSLMQLSEAAEEDNRVTAAFDARMSGWIFLLRSRLDEAKVKLSAAAEKDVLAALGMVRVLAATDKPAAKAAAQQVLNRAPSGIMGVLLQVNLREQEAKVLPNEHAASLKPLLDKFPMEWLKIIDNPLMFYSLRGEPVRIAVPFGQPLLANVTLQNTSNYDLTIGRDGVLKPELWFDMQLGGVIRHRIPNAVVESIPEQIVLKPRQRINFTVRMDQGQLRDEILAANPTLPVGMMVTMRSNVLMGGNGTMMVAGPAGQSAEFRRMMERSPFVVNEQTWRGLMDTVGSLRGGDRIRAMHLLHELASGMIGRAMDTGDEAALKSAGERGAEVKALFRKHSFDEDPDVKAYAAFFYAREAGGEDRPQEVRTMLKDAAWQVRLLGLVTMRIRNPKTGEPLIDIKQQEAMAQELLDKETEPHVRDYAAAVLELLKNPAPPPATQPAPRG